MALAHLEFKGQSYELSYELLYPHNTKTLLILHGWGANKELMKQAFKDSFKTYKHIYIDLPGFGKSSIAKALDSKEYTLLIKAFLEQKNFKAHLIMGHSFGGKIASALSLDLNCEKLILLSSAGIITQKSLKTKAKIFLFKVLKKLGFSSFYTLFASKDVKGMTKLMYETFKKVVDEDYSELFAKLTCKSLIFWGQDDKATPLKSGQKIHELIKNSHFYALNGDHFFFLEQAKSIEELSLKEK